MAERYRGPHSPDASVDASHPPVAPHPFDGKRRSRAGGRSNILFLAPVPFLMKGFAGDTNDLILGLSAAALLGLSAWLTREGLRAQDAFDARRVAKRPAFPRKIAAAALIGLGLGAGAVLGDAALWQAAVIAVIAAGLHIATFGVDPLRHKGLEGVDDFQADRVARVVDEAEVYLAGMSDAIRRAREPALEARVARFADLARAMFRTIEADPADLAASRKDLSVYLRAARDATATFADLHAQRRNPAARVEYEALLTDLETHFANRTQALVGNAHASLDVEIQVLRERLKLETNPTTIR